MNLFWAILIVVVTTSVAIAAMLLVRRNAPDGSRFADGDRASGVFGVLATGFSVLVGFVVFLAFTSYDASRAGAEEEALLVAQQIEVAQFLPSSAELTGELACYGRYVANVEWEQMEDGELGERVNPWGVRMFETLRSVDPETAPEQAAFGKWLDQTSDREQARSDRIHGAAGVIPTPVWVALFFASGIIFIFMLFFADSGELVASQAALMGTAVSVIVAMLLLLYALNNPFHPGFGGLRPSAMERTLEIVDQELKVIGRDTLPCDVNGRPT